MAPGVAEQAHQGAVRVPRAGEREHPDAGRAHLRRARQGARRTRAGEVQRGLEVVEFACGIPQLLKGDFSDQVSTDVDVYSFRQPLGVVAGHHPVQLPGHGADVDASRRHRLRQHVRAQAERAGPVGVDPRRRAVAAGRAAGRRVQRRARRQGRRRRAPRPPRTSRRSPSSAPPRSRGTSTSAASGERQAGAGPRRRQEPRDRPARRRPRLRRPTTSPRPPSAPPASGAWRSRRPSRSAPPATALVRGPGAQGERGQGRPRPGPGQRDGAAWSPPPRRSASWA